MIKIGNRYIGKGQPAYIIAEMSANHAGDIDNAKKIIRAAKEAGADIALFGHTHYQYPLLLASHKVFAISGNMRLSLPHCRLQHHFQYILKMQSPSYRTSWQASQHL